MSNRNVGMLCSRIYFVYILQLVFCGFYVGCSGEDLTVKDNKKTNIPSYMPENRQNAGVGVSISYELGFLKQYNKVGFACIGRMGAGFSFYDWDPVAYKSLSMPKNLCHYCIRHIKHVWSSIFTVTPAFVIAKRFAFGPVVGFKVDSINIDCYRATVLSVPVGVEIMYIISDDVRVSGTYRYDFCVRRPSLFAHDKSKFNNGKGAKLGNHYVGVSISVTMLGHKFGLYSAANLTINGNIRRFVFDHESRYNNFTKNVHKTYQEHKKLLEDIIPVLEAKIKDNQNGKK